MSIDLELRVREVMAENLMIGLAELTPQTQLVDDLYLDSLDLLDMVMALNEAFGIEVGAPDLAGARTVADVCAMVARLQTSSAPASEVLSG